jgi:plasmid stabilization system protein ParE
VKLHWSRLALTRLEEIHAYIAQDNPAAALRTTQQIVHRVGQIAAFPNSGRRVPDYTRDDVRELIEGNYRIIYRLLADHIDVVAVMHCAQLLPTDLSDL